MATTDSPASKLRRRAQDVLSQLVAANDDWERAYRRLKSESAQVEADLRVELGAIKTGQLAVIPAAISSGSTAQAAAADPSTTSPSIDSAQLLQQLGFSSPSSLSAYLTSHPLPPGGIPALHSLSNSTADLADALAAGLADARAAWEGQEALERAVEDAKDGRREAELAAAGWGRRCEELEAATAGKYSAPPLVVGSPSPAKKPDASSCLLTPSRKANLPASPQFNIPPAAAPPTPPAALLLAQNASLREALRARQAQHRSDRRHWRQFTGKVVELYQQSRKAEVPPGVQTCAKEPALTAPAWNPFTSSARPPPTMPFPTSSAATRPAPPPPMTRSPRAALGLASVTLQAASQPAAAADTSDPTAAAALDMLDADANPFLSPAPPTPRPAAGPSSGDRPAVPSTTPRVPPSPTPSDVPKAPELVEVRHEHRRASAEQEPVPSPPRPFGLAPNAPPALPSQHRFALSAPSMAPPPPPLPSPPPPSTASLDRAVALVGRTGRILVRASESVSSLTPLSSSPGGRSPFLADADVDMNGGEEDEDDFVGTSVPQERASYRFDAACPSASRPARRTPGTTAAARPGAVLNAVDQRLLDLVERESERWERQKQLASASAVASAVEPTAAIAAREQDEDVFIASPSNQGGQARPAGQLLTPPLPPPAKRRRVEAEAAPDARPPSAAASAAPSRTVVDDGVGGNNMTPAAAHRLGGRAGPTSHLPTPETGARPSTAAAERRPKATPTAAQPSAATSSRRPPPSAHAGTSAVGPTSSTTKSGKERWLGRHIFDERVRDGPPTPLSALGPNAGGKRKLDVRREGDGEADDFDADIDTPVRDGGVRPLAFGFDAAAAVARGPPAVGGDDESRRRKGKGRALDLASEAASSSTSPAQPVIKTEPLDSVTAFRANVPNAHIPILVHDSPPASRPAWNRTSSEEAAEAARYRALEGPTKGMSAAERKAFNRSLRDKPAEEVRALFGMFKGRGRYADGGQTDADRTINRDFEIDPERNQGRDYAFNSVVRNRDERRQMHGTDCECCRGYYEAVGPLPALPSGPVWRRAAAPALGAPADESAAEKVRRERAEGVEQHRQAVSRHREEFAAPQTPPQYFETGMFDDDQIDAINAEASRRAAEKRKRIEKEAAKGDGKYRRRS